MKGVTLLSGPVGAGKTIVAKELVALLPGQVVYIEGDTFWSFFAKSAESRSLGQNFRTVMAAMVASAIPYAMAEYQVIVDFSIPPWFLDTALRLASARDIPLHYIVLRPPQDLCAARAASRPEGKITDYTPYQHLYASFDGTERYMINEDGADAAAIAKSIANGLDADLFRVIK